MPSRALPTADDALAAGVRYILASQNEDGSWGSFDSARPYEVYLDNLSSHRAFRTATTALCLMALHEPSRADGAALAALDRALEYLLTAEPPGRASGETFYNTWAHTYSLQAMAVMARDDRFTAQRAEIKRIFERELQTMRDLQTATGGWGYYDFGHALTTPTGDQATSFNTAAALMALDEARDSGFEVPQAMIDDGLSRAGRTSMASMRSTTRRPSTTR
jgi:hypothetical protein